MNCDKQLGLVMGIEESIHTLILQHGSAKMTVDFKRHLLETFKEITGVLKHYMNDSVVKKMEKLECFDLLEEQSKISLEEFAKSPQNVYTNTTLYKKVEKDNNGQINKKEK